ncbi:hypothetical protein L1049_009997 [Liquidambar formosana]|uniref:Pentatricopeptide repeat-containing protein n=1 Tax=Liquidambar formosana TaxID=63359 RepID=A0AAP0R403_LIQFO
MCSQLHIILLSLKHSAHNLIQLEQILTQTITTGLIHTTPTWNCIVRAYSKSPTPIKAILIYNHFIEGSSIRPDNYTYPALLKACSRLPTLPKGKEVHAHVTKIGFDSDIYVQNALIHFYGSTAQIIDARCLFDLMPRRDVASWNTLLGVYNTSQGSWIEVLVLFKRMMDEGVGPDRITLVNLLSSCAQAGGVVCPKGVHAYIIKMGFGGKLSLENALLAAYTKCREIDAALALFLEMDDRRDVVSCTIMINGYVEMGLGDLARGIFDQIVDKDLVLWNSMIHGYVKAKRPKEALQLFKKMENEMVRPDETTIVSVLVACASLVDLQYGTHVHRFVLQNNIRQDVFVGTALIDMYSKCGSLETAMVTFYKMHYKDVFTWTTVIEGLANNGYGSEALSLFNQMEKENIKPNEATFVSVLMACSRSGLVNEGCLLFNRMVSVYKIQPKVKHFSCLVDLLSRAGLLHHAKEFIEIMPPEERIIAYKTLLSACVNYLEINLGEKVANELMKLGSPSQAIYILKSNLYAQAGQWDEVAETRRIVKEFEMGKEPGTSSIDLNIS